MPGSKGDPSFENGNMKIGRKEICTKFNSV